MDFAGASRDAHAVRRLLGHAALVALLALGLAAASARAQVAEPPIAPPDQIAPGQDPGEPDWDEHDAADGNDWPDGDGNDWPDGSKPGGDDGGFDERAEEQLPPVTSAYVAGTRRGCAPVARPRSRAMRPSACAR